MPRKDRAMTDTASAAPSLAPCPFCGGAAAFVKHSAGMPRTMGYDQWHGVSCRSCNACVGASDRRFRERSDALAAWNRRAPQPVAREPLTASEVEQLLAQWSYDIHGDRARYLVRMTELHHGTGAAP